MASVLDKLLLSVIKNKDEKTLLRIDPEWIDKHELRRYHYVVDYYRDHSEMVGLRDFCAKFDLSRGEGESRPTLYLRELKERFISTQLMEEIPMLLRKVKSNPRKTLEEFTELLSKLNSEEDITTSESLYSEDAMARFEEYEERVKTGGISYIRFGHPVLDELMFGLRKTDLITFGGRAGSKKCLSAGTKLRMYDGSVKVVEEVRVGDLLMGPDGSPRTVLQLYGGREQMYWVHQNKGMSYRVNESHILSLKDKRPIAIRQKGSRENRTYLGSAGSSDKIVNISVRDYLKKSKTWKKYHKGYKGKLDFVKSPVLIDPYFLGLWLGDGGKHKIEITAEEKEIIQAIYTTAEQHGLEVTINYSEGKTPQYTITGGVKGKLNPLAELFREYNLLNNPSNKKDNGEKHIPIEYIHNDRETRLQLLAGLLDTDGCYANGCFTITQKNKRLAKDIAYLCQSLGYYVNINDKAIAKLKSRNYECEVTCLYISGDFSDLPTRLKRKKARKRLINKDVSITGIDVVKDVVDEFYGFEIDGDHLFCLEDLTVTHNTFLLCYLAIIIEKHLPDDFGEVLFVTNEVPSTEIKERMDAMRFYLNYKKFLAGKLSPTEVRRYRNGLEDLEETPSRIRIIENCTKLTELRLRIKLYNPAVCLLDGSYLMEPQSTRPEWEKVTLITRGLKFITNHDKCPIINTTQLKRASGKNEKNTSADAQDEFAYSNSYSQDSDIAFRMFSDKDMIFRNEVGLQIAKGRRLPPGAIPVFYAPLDTMEFDFTLPDDDMTVTSDDDVVF